MAGRGTGRVGLGLGLIVVGLLTALDQAGVLDLGSLSRYWPLLLVAFGLAGLWQGRGGLVPLLLLGAGVLLQLHTLDILRLRPAVILPVALILLGLRMLWPRATGPAPEGEGKDGQGTVDLQAVLGSLEHRVRSDAFRGGRVQVLLGGCDLDLRAATCAPGGAVLDLFVLCGGLEMRVPRGWTVVLEATPLLGGVENKSASAEGTPSPDARLVLRGTILMGGVEVRN